MTDPEQMARKTVIKRTGNYLELSPELTEALQHIDLDEEPSARVEREVYAPPPAPVEKKLPEATYAETVPEVAPVSQQPETVSRSTVGAAPVAQNQAASGGAPVANPSPPRTEKPAEVSIEEQMRLAEQAKAEAGIAAEAEAKRKAAEKAAAPLPADNPKESVGSFEKSPSQAAPPAEGTGEFADWLIEAIRAAGAAKDEVRLRALAQKASSVPPARKAQVDMEYRAAKGQVKA